jgi:hypothetical protein
MEIIIIKIGNTKLISLINTIKFYDNLQRAELFLKRMRMIELPKEYYKKKIKLGCYSGYFYKRKYKRDDDLNNSFGDFVDLEYFTLKIPTKNIDKLKRNIEGI